MVKKSSLYPDYMGNCCEHVWGGCWYWVSRATQSQQLKWRLLILCCTCNTISTTKDPTPSIRHFSLYERAGVWMTRILSDVQGLLICGSTCNQKGWRATRNRQLTRVVSFASHVQPEIDNCVQREGRCTRCTFVLPDLDNPGCCGATSAKAHGILMLLWLKSS